MNYDNLTDPKPDELLGRLIAEKLAALRAHSAAAVVEGEALIATKLGAAIVVANRNASVLHDSRSNIRRDATTRPSIIPSLQGFQRIGLGVIVIIIIAFVGIKYIPEQSFPQTKTYSTERGQRSSITLVDGSTIILAPATVLRVSGRSVELSGEAVFTVNNKNKDPFIVKSGNVVTRVLGTTFDVRAYDHNVRIAVRDGRVAASLQTPFQHLIASEGDIIIINNGKTAIQHNSNIASAFSWTSGRLEFRRAPLSQVAADISRWYDVDVNIAAGIAQDAEITGAFTNTNLEAVLLTISQSLGVHYKVAGRTVTIFP